MLEVNGLSKRFGGLTAVSQLSFRAERGRVTSLIGPNGAGKSTAFNLVSGAIRPDGGRVSLGSREVTGWSPQRLNRAGVCRSFQITNLLFESTVFENVRIAAQARLPRRSFFSAAALASAAPASVDAARLLRDFGLDAMADLPARQLSHGDQRRLEIAVCMAGRPVLLMLDEPTQGMSMAETRETALLIRRLADEGVAVVLVEHDIELVMALSHHVVVMQQGALIAEGPPARVRADRKVQQAYLGTPPAAGHPDA
jgi:branched-chain amino acid transport system ATP-binding protein